MYDPTNLDSNHDFLLGSNVTYDCWDTSGPTYFENDRSQTSIVLECRLDGTHSLNESDYPSCLSSKLQEQVMQL